jgi:hypothetical protein
MQRMKPSWVAHPGRVLFQGLVACSFLISQPAFSAIDAQPVEEEAAKPAAPAKTIPAADIAPAAIKPLAAPSEDYKATKKIPKKLLLPLLGCWQLDGQERWSISRLDASGAQVVTKLIKSSKKRADRVSFPDYARRAAVPATLMYDAKEDNFGFSTADRIHATLVIFRHSGPILEASLFSKRSSKLPYTFSGNSATLDRCIAPVRQRADPARAADVPPRLK